MVKSLVIKLFTGYFIITSGALIVLLSDIVRFTRAFNPPVDPTIEIIRFIGLLLFFLGVIIKFINLDDSHHVSYGQHERMWDEIRRTQIHTGLRLPEEVDSDNPENHLTDR